jgi:hypothetical protein
LRLWLLSALLCLWVLLTNVSPDFTPVSSELRNARGFSRGILNLVVLPAAEPFRGAPLWAIGVAIAALLLLAKVQPHPAGAVRGGFAEIAGTAILLVVATGPLVTPYRVVLAPRTFVLCAALVSARRLVRVARLTPVKWRPVLAGALGAAFFASALVQTAAAYDWNYSAFLHLDRSIAARAPFLRERPDLAQSLITYDAGYDGQFMYLMAFDPLLRRFADSPSEYGAFIDSPPYRYGRIGFSALTALFSAERPERYPAVMLWLIVAAHLILATILANLAVASGMSPFAGLLYLAIPGFMSSLMSALPEALAAAGLVAGYFFWESRRVLAAAVAFAGALLVRETGVALLVMLIVEVAGDRPLRRRAIVMLAGALAPVTIWRLFVASRLFGEFGWAALFTNPGDLGAPFAGLSQLWTAGIGGTQPASEIPGAVVFPVILTVAFVLAVAMWRLRAGALERAAAIYASVAVSLNYEKIWSHLPSGERGTFELFVCLLLLLLARRDGPAWSRLALKAFFGTLLAYTFFVAADAATSRLALGLIR